MTGTSVTPALIQTGTVATASSIDASPGYTTAATPLTAPTGLTVTPAISRVAGAGIGPGPEPGPVTGSGCRLGCAVGCQVGCGVGCPVGCGVGCGPGVGLPVGDGSMG
ncbi:hypothetical protein [Micromonospora craniellae]|uniref:hypothetical protein n=1 Tax=Micromonospora craniellae TaxID=2294034 RepID=UPI0018F15029|nr:hypothetical protein [Micromonospora craniellae]